MKISYFCLFFILSFGISAQSPGLSIETTLTSQPLYAGPVEFISEPPLARIFISGILWGQTPLTLPELNPGKYILEVTLEGYKPFTTELILESGKAYKILTKLEITTGFLALKNLKSWETVELFKDHTLLSPITPGVYNLPTGHHTLTLNVFGFAAQNLEVDIKAEEVLTLTPVLTPADFKIVNLNIWPRVINFENPGDLGSLKLTFSVSAPGTAELRISTPEGQVLLLKTLGPFSTWNQSLVIKDELETWPQGTLNLEILTPDSKFTTKFEVQNTYDLTLRSQGPWGSSLGIALLPELLPHLGFRISTIGGMGMENSLPQWEMGAFGALGLGSIFEAGLGIQKKQEMEFDSYLKTGMAWGPWTVSLGLSGKIELPSGFQGDVFTSLDLKLGSFIGGISGIISPFPLPLGSMPLEVQGVLAWDGNEFLSGVNGSYNFANANWKIFWSTLLLLPGSGTYLSFNPGLQGENASGLNPYFSLEAGFFQ